MSFRLRYRPVTVIDRRQPSHAVTTQLPSSYLPLLTVLHYRPLHTVTDRYLSLPLLTVTHRYRQLLVTMSNGNGQLLSIDVKVTIENIPL